MDSGKMEVTYVMAHDAFFVAVLMMKVVGENKTALKQLIDAIYKQNPQLPTKEEKT